MEIKELVDLSRYTTFRMGPLVRYFAAVCTVDELREGYAFAKSTADLPVFILGSGSNIILGQSGVFEALVLKIELPGYEVLENNNIGAEKDDVLIKVGAGEIWDDVVKHTVEMGLSGIEALSAIPGTAGATPIQNVGAYGQEVGNVLVSLEAYEVATGNIRIFSNEECQFKYRDSIFKRELKNQYVITSIVLKLSKRPGHMPDYSGVKKYFEDSNITQPTLVEIRQAIIDIRSIKLPDPKQIASVGSFFKNPFVKAKHYEQLQEQYPQIIAFPLSDGNYKIAAGWMLEAMGLKGQQFGNLLFYQNHALVVVNTGQATYTELENLIKDTQAKVRAVFGVELEMEPTIVI